MPIPRPRARWLGSSCTILLTLGLTEVTVWMMPSGRQGRSDWMTGRGAHVHRHQHRQMTAHNTSEAWGGKYDVFESSNKQYLVSTRRISKSVQANRLKVFGQCGAISALGNGVIAGRQLHNVPTPTERLTSLQ
jgi:hypothetical protein